MPLCAVCGEEHPFLDPTFRRPEAYVRLDARAREEDARANDDLCWIALPGESPRSLQRHLGESSVTCTLKSAC